jgi:anti-anti-sigma regulatory factor
VAPSTRSELAELVIDHLAALAGGECAITRADIEAAGDDPTLAQVLSGLFHLHEDLQYGEQQRRDAQAARDELNQLLDRQNQDLRQQREALGDLLRDLSSVILDVGPSILLVPLVGRYERERVADLTARLLERTVARRARHVILDCTGVSAIDESIAAHLIGLMRSLRLVGAQVIVTGISPGNAALFAHLGIPLPALAVVRGVDQALRRCLLEVPAGSRPAGPPRPAADQRGEPSRGSG